MISERSIGRIIMILRPNSSADSELNQQVFSYADSAYRNPLLCDEINKHNFEFNEPSANEFEGAQQIP